VITELPAQPIAAKPVVSLVELDDHLIRESAGILRRILRTTQSNEIAGDYRRCNEEQGPFRRFTASIWMLPKRPGGTNESRNPSQPR
jgi:hypothetical protein